MGGMRLALELAEQDAEAFDNVMLAFRLPKGNQTEVEERNKSIFSATLAAATTPLETANEAITLLCSITELARHGNSNALTDLAAAAELAHTAAYIAGLNVRINTDSIEGDESDEIDRKIESLLTESSEVIEDIRGIISRRLGW
jgi:formiminotetrahydrofolate cyclodeaminase